MDMHKDTAAPVTIFYAYAHEDEWYRDQLEKHLSLLRLQSIISEWHDRKVMPGMDWARAIDDHLQNASIILLLISPDFLASDYCYGIEMQRTLEQHKTGHAVAIPILLRAVDWKGAPFAHLQCLPRNEKPIKAWRDRDAAFSEIAREIRLVAGHLRTVPESAHYSSIPFETFSPSISGGPRTYIPFPRDPLFQSRPGEFERLEMLLGTTRSEQGPLCVGLVGITGMGGVGKTQLAIQLAYRFLDQQRFSAGIFWMTAMGEDVYDWRPRFAELALRTGYLPPHDDISSPENETRRAVHICCYLASHDDALLILDNVEDPKLVFSALPFFAGKEAACAILYTSRSTLALPGITTHSVDRLPIEGALRLLLESTRPAQLSEISTDGQDAESQAALSVCRGVGYLPLALVHLRGLLARDQQLTLIHLADVLKQRGVLAVTKVQRGNAPPLFATFRLSWKKVQQEGEQQLFKLASYFPEATPIPLWLLGIAAGLGESGGILEPLGEALLHLQEVSLIEELSGNQIRLHPLVREFGQRLVAEESEHGKTLLEEAGERLLAEFADLKQLEYRARREGFWVCLERVRKGCEYAALLGTDKREQLGWIERWLDRESYLLGDEWWWPQELPGLFYQQLHNRSVEEGRPLVAKEAPVCWLRQENQVLAEDQSLLRIFADYSSVSSVAFSPDGSQVLTGSSNHTARLWETTSGKLLQILEGHTGEVSSVAFSSDGMKMLTGSYDHTARLWDATSGKLLQTLEGHTWRVNSVAFSPDGSQVLTGSDDETTRLWETASEQALAIFAGHTWRVNSVAFSPDGSQVLTGSETARLWETTSGKLLQTLEGDTGGVNSVMFSPDGKRILTGSYDHTARLWKTTSGQMLASFAGHNDSVTSVTFSPDGKRVLTGSYDHTARLWDAASGKLLQTLEGHTGEVSSVAFSSDGSQILTGSWDGTARLWDVTGEKLLQTSPGYSERILRIAFSPDGAKAITSSFSGTAQLWEVAGGKLFQTLEGHTSEVSSMAFSPDGAQVLTGSDDHTARLWETASGKLLQILEGHTGKVWSVAFSPDGAQVLTGSDDHTARLWETASGKLLRTLEGHSRGVYAAMFSPDGAQVLTGSSFGTARLWEATSGKLLQTLEGPHGQLEGLPNNAAFSPDGTKVLTISGDGWVRLWEIASGKLLQTLEDPIGMVETMAFSPDGRHVVTCYQTGYVLIWRIGGSEIDHPLGLYIATYTISAVHWQDATHLVLADTGGPCSRLHIYRLKLEGEW